jgi:hypothetical protein
MKKPKRKKPEPKFWKGQVVTMADDKEGYLFRVAKVSNASCPEFQYLDESAILRYGTLWHDESELRPLTATEIGPRRNRG